MEKNLIDVNRQIRKYKHQKEEAETKLRNLKEEYRDELVKECVYGLMEIYNKEKQLTERDLTIFIRNLSHDIRNLYFN